MATIDPSRWQPHERLLVERLVLAIALPLVAGEVNAIGFSVVGTFTSHMTGNTTRIGDELAQGHSHAAGHAALVVGLFFAGALLATVLMEWAKRAARARYVGPLAIEFLALVAFATLFTLDPPAGGGDTLLLTALLCVAMGLQNATVTHISDAVVRTTHLTGLITDSAVELGRLVSFTWGWRGRAGADAGQSFWRALYHQRDCQKLRLHLSITASFLLGAFVGPGLFIQFGSWSLMVPCGILVLLGLFDAVVGIPGAPRA